MTDIALVVKGGRLDIDLGAPGLDLQTSVLLSLFTDARAETDDPLPSNIRSQDRGQVPPGTLRGCWTDNYPTVEGDRIGSKLWLLRREKQTQETLNRAKQYANEALAWIVEDGIASNVTVTAEWVRMGLLGFRAEITRPNGQESYRFDYLWDLLKGGVTING